MQGLGKHTSARAWPVLLWNNRGLSGRACANTSLGNISPPRLDGADPYKWMPHTVANAAQQFFVAGCSAPGGVCIREPQPTHTMESAWSPIMTPLQCERAESGKKIEIITAFSARASAL